MREQNLPAVTGPFDSSVRQHTPGPWVVRNGVQIRSQQDQIAKVWMMRQGEGNANARLIAAAPELLEVLRHILRCIPMGGFAQIHHGSSTWEQIDAVITKALGPDA